ncbi:MAG: flavodoxin family protein [Bacilli bacterium]|nr:flavodoxin family protein [Bacilli bacterium]
MRVLILNGSPHKDGCTSTALKEVEKILNQEGIETQTLQIGNLEIRGCIACNYCKEHKKCVFDDVVNESAKIFEQCDGLLIGSPVYYSGASGTLLSFLDRFFHSSYIKKSMKVGAAILSSRRAGSTSALDEIYKYFGISNMPIATSTYWNEVHGFTKEDVLNDKEGVQTMHNLARNMAFLMKSIELGKKEYGLPQIETGTFTNFMR